MAEHEAGTRAARITSALYRSRIALSFHVVEEVEKRGMLTEIALFADHRKRVQSTGPTRAPGWACGSSFPPWERIWTQAGLVEAIDNRRDVLLPPTRRWTIAKTLRHVHPGTGAGGVQLRRRLRGPRDPEKRQKGLPGDFSESELVQRNAALRAQASSRSKYIISPRATTASI